MNKKWIYGAAIVVLIAVAGWYFAGGSNSGTSSDNLTVQPRFGTFEISVTTSGELRAKRSTRIMGPLGARNANLSQIKISNLVPEGTIVEKGDFVAELDKTELAGKISEADLNVQKFRSELEQAQLDCTLTLSQAREEIVNLRYALEQSKLEKEQSAFEPPATQRKREIDYQKAQRTLDQAKENYKTKVRQAEAKMKIAQNDLQKELNKFNQLLKLEDEFTVRAPDNGMVIYYREWSGKKRVVGSTINTWSPIVATLPDLSEMISKTSVNEVDIQKIKPKQKVTISLDAMPDKKLEGEIVSVANIGEELENSDAKVFEVEVKVLDPDSTLRPAMTTSNKIHIESVPDVLYIPLAAVYSENSQSIVYKKAGGSIVKQEIKIGKVNDEFAVVEQGLSKEDEIFLNIPKGMENEPIVEIKVAQAD